MKNLLITIFLFITTVSFATNNVTISGKILNHTQNLLIIRGEKYNIEIDVNKNGEFKKTFELEYTGVYNISYGDYDFKLYLTKDNNIIFNANENDFLNSLYFNENLSTENNYLIKKQITTLNIIGSEEDFFQLNESDFLTKFNLWKKETLKFYYTTEFKDSYFKTHEIKNINYTEYYYLNFFSIFHYTDDGKLNLSKNFPKNNIDVIFDFNNTEDYLFSEVYLKMIDSEWDNHVQRLIKNNEKSEIKVTIEELKKLNNEFLENKILNGLYLEITPSNPDLDFLYNELMQLIKNDNWKKAITEKYNKVKLLVKGSQSPTFNFENYDGSYTTLESLKGKYIYIDVWATWCGPCNKEIPYLEKLQKDFKNKNIAFVSISVDSKKETWQQFITKKGLKGIHLFTEKVSDCKFIQDYFIESIPRFILLDKEGKIIDADALKPSNPKLIEIFKNLP